MKCKKRDEKYRTVVNEDSLISVPHLEHVLMTHQLSKVWYLRHSDSDATRQNRPMIQHIRAYWVVRQLKYHKYKVSCFNSHGSKHLTKGKRIACFTVRKYKLLHNRDVGRYYTYPYGLGLLRVHHPSMIWYDMIGIHLMSSVTGKEASRSFSKIYTAATADTCISSIENHLTNYMNCFLGSMLIAWTV